MEALIHSLCTFKDFISDVKLTKLYLQILVQNKDSFCGLKILDSSTTRTWSESVLSAVAFNVVAKQSGGERGVLKVGFAGNFDLFRLWVGKWKRGKKRTGFLMPICSCFRDLETDVLNFLVLVFWFMQL